MIELRVGNKDDIGRKVQEAAGYLSAHLNEEAVKMTDEWLSTTLLPALRSKLIEAARALKLVVEEKSRGPYGDVQIDIVLNMGGKQ